MQQTLGARASSPATIAGEDARAPRQTAVITVSYIEGELQKSNSTIGISVDSIWIRNRFVLDG